MPESLVFLLDRLPYGFLTCLASPLILKPIPYHKPLKMYVLLILLLWLNLDWYTKGVIVINKWIWWTEDIPWSFHIWMERENKALGGHGPLTPTSWDQKPDLPNTFAQLLSMDLALAGHWGQGCILMSCLIGHWLTAYQPLGGRGGMSKWSIDQKFSTERSWNGPLATPGKSEHELIYPTPDPSQDGRSQDELETADGCQKESGGCRTGSLGLCVEV